MQLLGWRKGSAVKPEFIYLFAALAELPGSVPYTHIYANSQHAIIPVPGNPVPYSDIHIYHMCRQNSNVYENSHLMIEYLEVTICSGVVV